MRNWNTRFNSHIGKGNLVISLPMRNWNYYRLIVALNLKRVISLPMRNWNIISNSTGSPRSSLLLAYLWGIEIIIMIFYIVPSVLLLAYLWGIEISFEQFLYLLVVYLLLAYLWGIEIFPARKIIGAVM